jgi:protein involved in polysaccharide export with SLBB domain
VKLIRITSNLLIIIAVSALLVSCASQQELRKIPPPSPLATIQPTAAYIIQPGDQLDIKFFYNPELNESVTVRPDGKISLQLVDEVQTAGLQPAELDEMLTRQYSQELKKPEVTVIVKSFTGQRIYVGGEVNQQREMTLPAGMTILQAVFQAGGFMETASPENTILIRQGPNKEPIPIRIDLKDALYSKGDGANLVLKPNDIVYVPKSAIAEANKWVNQYIEKLILFRGFSAGVTYQINKFK